MSILNRIIPFVSKCDSIEYVSREIGAEVLNIYFVSPDGEAVFTLQLDAKARTAFMVESRRTPSYNWEYDIAALNRAFAVVVALGYRTGLS